VRSLCGISATAGRKGISALFGLLAANYPQPDGNRQTFDLFMFFADSVHLTYGGGTGLIMAIARNRAPVLSRLQDNDYVFLGNVYGLKRVRKDEKFRISTLLW